MWEYVSARAVIILLAINLFLLARAVEAVRFPGELSEVEIARQGAAVLARHYESVAKNSHLERNPAVRDALAQFRFELEQATTPEGVASAISLYGKQVQEILAREQESMLHERIKQIVSQDPRLGQFKGNATVRVAPLGTGQVQVDDPSELLTAQTRELLASDPAVLQLTQVVEIEVLDGKINLLTPRTLPEQVDALRKEAALLRSTLQELRKTAGYAPLSGPGLVILVRPPYSPKKGLEGEATLYGSEIRDVVNELLAAGAAGVEVGGERLIATTSIRNAGSALLVNNRVVQTNPLVIKAVGDPKILMKSLDLVMNSPYFEPVLEFRLEENLTLQAYRPER